MATYTITVKQVVEFATLTERRQKTFVKKLSEVKSDAAQAEGRDYWIRSLSGIGTAFKLNDNSIIKYRIELIEEEKKKPIVNQTRIMYDRNISNLQNFESYDFNQLRVNPNISFKKHEAINSKISIQDIDLKVKPSFLFEYQEKQAMHIGAVCFVSKKDGFRLSELAVFAEATYLCLEKNYKQTHALKSTDVIVVDITNGEKISYEEVINGSIQHTPIENIIYQIKNSI